MFNIFLCSHLGFFGTYGHIEFIKNNYTLDSLWRVCKHKTEIYTTWRIDRLPVQGTWLILVTQSVIWGSMWPTRQTSNNSVIDRCWRCFLPSGPRLALPHTSKWLEAHFTLFAKIIAYAVFQLSLSHWLI